MDYTIYTDGSYDRTRKLGVWAAVLVKNGAVTKTVTEVGPTMSANIGAECNAVRLALDQAANLGARRVDIRHDYAAFPLWLKDARSAHSDVGKDFRGEMIPRIARFDEVRFTHVKGHAGNRFNCLADHACTNAYMAYEEQRIRLAKCVRRPVKSFGRQISGPDLS
jgi:ribonuclease HI